MKDNDTTITQLGDLVKELHEQVLKLKAFEATHIHINTLMKIASDYNHLLNEAFSDLKEALKAYENNMHSEPFNNAEDKWRSPDVIQIMKKIEHLSFIIKDIRESFSTVNNFIP